MGRRVGELVEPDDAAEQALLDVLGGARWHGDLTIRRADDTLVAAVAVTPIHDAAGGVVGAIIALEDMTEIRRADGRGRGERPAAPAGARGGRARDLALERRRRHQRLGRPDAPHLRSPAGRLRRHLGRLGQQHPPRRPGRGHRGRAGGDGEPLHLRAAQPDRAPGREAALDRGARQGARRPRREPRGHDRLRPGRDRADPDAAAAGGRRRAGAAAPGGHGRLLPGADARPGRRPCTRPASSGCGPSSARTSP